MTRADVRQRCGDRSVLTIALGVHMTHTGATERSKKDQEEDRQLLKDVLETWEKPTNSPDFDRAVKDLIEFAIFESS